MEITRDVKCIGVNDHNIDLYRTWSSYAPEEEGVVIAYTSALDEKSRAQLAALAVELCEN